MMGFEWNVVTIFWFSTLVVLGWALVWPTGEEEEE